MTSEHEAHHLIRQAELLAGAAVLCVGDVMLDHFTYGEVSRISPEAPVPVMRVHRQQSMLGGAGNTVRNLAALGARVQILSVVGDDPAGHTVVGLLSECPGCQVLVEREPARPTTVKTRFIAQGQQLMRADQESEASVSQAALERLLERFSAALPFCSAVLLSDYNKGVLSHHHAAEFIRLARRAGKPVIVDPKAYDYSRYEGATLIKPNVKELAEATGCARLETEAEVLAAARKLLMICECEFVLTTRGSAGMLLVDRNGGSENLPAVARDVFDVSGAGDTVAATVAACIAAGGSALDAAKLANIAAGIVVGKLGTATVDRSELVRNIHHRELMDADAKLVAADRAVEIAREWQRAGLRVGFTNGCFDLLHPGHISLLEQARSRCDRLVVGLNSDSSVSRLKGPSRPIQDEAARALVLGSLQTVDLIIVFGEDTPEGLVRQLRPDLMVKGADYKAEDVVGADLVKSWGGELYLAKLVPGRSTTKTVSTIASAYVAVNR